MNMGAAVTFLTTPQRLAARAPEGDIPPMNWQGGAVNCGTCDYRDLRGRFALHAALAAFMVLGLPAIWLGWLLGRSFVHDPRFRIPHLLAMAWVAAEAALGLACPLTLLENRLRSAAGRGGYPGGFVEHWVERLLYHDWPAWIFPVLHIAFFALVLLTLLAVPIRRSRPR